MPAPAIISALGRFVTVLGGAVTLIKASEGVCETVLDLRDTPLTQRSVI
jgi:hypothetical protein